MSGLRPDLTELAEGTHSWAIRWRDRLDSTRRQCTNHVLLTAGRLLHRWEEALPGPVRSHREARHG